MNRLARGALLAAFALGYAACASGSFPAPRSDSPPRVRCLSDPRREAGETTRPMFFFFCAESP
jgi:hypothetical protein